jgi:hypothetical protein
MTKNKNLILAVLFIIAQIALSFLAYEQVTNRMERTTDIAYQRMIEDGVPHSYAGNVVAVLSRNDLAMASYILTTSHFLILLNGIALIIA